MATGTTPEETAAMADDDTTTTQAGGTDGAATTGTTATATSTTGQAAATNDDDKVLEGLGDAGRRAIQAERDARRVAEAKVKDLEPLAQKARDLEEANKTELERVTGDRDTFKGRAETAEHELARIKAGIDAGVPTEWLERIKGNTPEELAVDAKALAAKLPKGGRPAPRDMQGRESGGGGTQSADDWLREQARN